MSDSFLPTCQAKVKEADDVKTRLIFDKVDVDDVKTKAQKEMTDLLQKRDEAQREFAANMSRQEVKFCCRRTSCTTGVGNQELHCEIKKNCFIFAGTGLDAAEKEPGLTREEEDAAG